MARARRKKARSKPKGRGNPRLLVAGFVGLIVVSAPIWGPRIGREIDWFDVKTVEVSGSRLLPPHEVLRLSGIHTGESVLSDRAKWVESLEKHPAIASATIRRKLPNVIRIRIEEERPVALIGNETLAFATAIGSVLPIDPSTVALDLPILAGSLDDDRRAATRRALAETGRLMELDGRLISAVAEIHPNDQEAASLRLMHRDAEIIVPTEVSSAQLEELRSVLADLPGRAEQKGIDVGSTRPIIDLRYDGQIVVRFKS